MDTVNEVAVIERVDLGNARVQTRQGSQYPATFWDSMWGWYAQWGD
jgi:hypothetical protein